MTLKTRLGVRQGHWKCHQSIQRIRLPIDVLVLDYVVADQTDLFLLSFVLDRNFGLNFGLRVNSYLRP